MARMRAKIGDIMKGRRVIKGKKYTPIKMSSSHKGMALCSEKLRRSGISARVSTTLEDDIIPGEKRRAVFSTLWVPTSQEKRAKQLLKG